MLNVGLTGNIASGKSTVARLFAEWGATVIDADLIYVIDAGRVAEAGTHAELLRRNGTYARLHALQFADEADAAELRA